jgi:hypothetical protein
MLLPLQIVTVYNNLCRVKGMFTEKKSDKLQTNDPYSVEVHSHLLQFFPLHTPATISKAT